MPMSTIVKYLQVNIHRVHNALRYKHTCARMHTRTHAHTHTHTHTEYTMHTCTYTCAHMHIHVRTHRHYNKVKPTNNNDLITAGLQLQGDIHNVPDFVQEPAINFSDLVQLINIIAGRIQRRSYCKYVLFSRIVQLLVTHKHTYTKPPYTKDNISTSYLFQRLFPAGLKPNY